MKTLIKILCLSSFLYCDTISYLKNNEQVVINDVKFNKCEIHDYEKVIYYQYNSSKIAEYNTKKIKRTGIPILISGILNLYAANKEIKSFDDYEEISLINNISSLSLVLAGISLFEVIDDSDKTESIDLWGESKRTLSILDDNGNEIEYECFEINKN